MLDSRGVAQPGSAPALGAGGRWFESSRPDDVGARMEPLTETTIRYLFATSWLPFNPGAPIVRVPGGSTTGLDTGGSLLDIALWNLRRQGLIEFEQVREVVDEPVRVLGGRSFSRFALLE